MDGFNFIYLKQLDNVNEIFSANTKIPSFAKRVILLFKQICGIVTIKENGLCILPYTGLKNHYRFKLHYIKRFLKNNNKPIVLSKYLESIQTFKDDILNEKFELINGKKLSNYIVPEIIEHICKMLNETAETQDITILVQNKTSNTEKIIIDIAKIVKRVQIVTPQIDKFKKIENELEFKYGLSCQITNNKRKSLLKSKIIVNIDYLEEELNQFVINKYAIVIDIKNNTSIHAKSFCRNSCIQL